MYFKKLKGVRNNTLHLRCLVSPEYIPCINFLFHVIQTSIIPVRDNRLALRFESVQVVHYLAAEEGAAVFQCRLVDDYFRTFGFHPLHYALDAGLAEVIAVRLHGQAVNADSALALLVGAEITPVVIVVISGSI